MSAQTDLTVIREVVPGVRIYSRPFARFGVVPFGGRSTAVRLADGNVLVVASTPLTDATRKSVDELGPVKYLVAPDALHYLFLKEWKTAFPSAHVAGVPDSEKNSGVKHDGVWGRDAQPLGPDETVNAEFKSEYFDGHANFDVALLHVPTKTLIEADLLFNLPAHEQHSAPGAPNATSGLLGWFGIIDKLGPTSGIQQHMLYNAVAKDRAKMAHSVTVVDAWDFARIIPCHGDVIEGNGKEMWRAAYKPYYDAIAAGKFKGVNSSA